jgi:hypothetical protein
MQPRGERARPAPAGAGATRPHHQRYRVPLVNRAGSGSPTSQHMLGEAADIKVDGVAAEALAAAIVSLGVPFDQVLWYAPERGGHVHVSFTEKRTNRRQTLHAPAGGGYVRWTASATRAGSA